MRRAVVVASVAGTVAGLTVPVALVTAAPGGWSAVGGSLTPAAVPGEPPAAPRLLFTGQSSATTPDDAADLWDVVAADGTDPRPVLESFATGSQGYSAPSYSPDGLRAVLASTVDGDDGGGQQLVLTALGADPAGVPEPLPSGWTPGTRDADPDWSTDGTRIVFSREQWAGDTLIEAGLMIVSGFAGGATPELADPFAGVDYAATVGELAPITPAWSPDGTRIVFTAHIDGSGELWILDLQAQQLFALTDAAGETVIGQGPDWSPDGTRVGYVDAAGDSLVSLELGDTDLGGDVPRIATEPTVLYPVPGAEPLGDLADPAWSPDGTEIAVATQGAAVYAVGVDRPTVREVAGGWQQVSAPVYQPWADVAVSVAGATPVAVGSPVVLWVTVTNHGPSAAWDTGVSVTIPALAAGQATLVVVPPGCLPAPESLTCSVPGALASGQPVVLRLALDVSQPGEHAATATVTTVSTDPQPGNDVAGTSLAVREPPGGQQQPRQAFTRQATGAPQDTSRDVADVPAGGGPHQLARLLAHQAVELDDGEQGYLEEAHPDYSPDGTRLLFSRTPAAATPSLAAPRLAVGDLDDGGLTGIRVLDYDTAAGAGDTQPVWSPDGEQVAFTRTAGDGPRQVHLLDVASGAVRALSPPGESVETLAASWSPDGTRLAVELWRSGESVELWVVHLDPAGDTWYPVGALLPDCTGGPEQCVDPVWGGSPAWSPDGTRIAAVDGYLGEDGPVDQAAVVVHEVPAQPVDGHYPVGGSEVLAGTPAGGEPGDLVAAWGPAWSPDGAEISFVGRLPDQTVDVLYAVPATGGTPEPRVAEWAEDRPGRYADPAYQPWSEASLTLHTPDRPVVAGDPVEVTATVTVAGPSAAWGAHLTIELPPGLELLDWDEACLWAGRTVSCALQGPVTGERDLTLVVRAEQPGDHPVSGELGTTTLDPEPGNNTDSVLVGIQPAPAADGVEPRLAFTYRSYLPDGQGADVADVHAPDGADFRVLAAQRFPDASGRSHAAVEVDPSYSPDGRRLVFSAAPSGGPDRTARLVVGDTRPGPTGLVDLAPLDDERPAGAIDSEPAWSPDGRRIAFVRLLDDETRLALLDVATGTVRRVAGLDGAVVGRPTWSPDGERIAVEVHGEVTTLAVVHPDDGRLWPLLPPGCAGPDAGCDLAGAEPSWSPDGGRLAYVQEYLTEAQQPVQGLFTVTLPAAPSGGGYRAGTPVRVAGPDPGEPLAADELPRVWGPDWALDGASLAFVGQPAGEESSVIYTVPAGGGTPQVLRAQVRAGVRHEFADLEYQPWADVGVTVSGPAQAPVGEPVELTVTVTNHGPSPAWGVRAELALPGDATRLGVAPAGCVPGGAVLTCTAPESLAVGASETYPLVLRPDTAGEHELTAQVTARSRDLVPGNDTDTATVRAVPPEPDPDGDLAVRLELGWATGWVGGDPLPATVVVTNTGPVAATDVVLTLSHPDQVTATAAGCATAQRCVLGALDAGADRTIRLDLLPTAEGSGTVRAAIAASTPDTDPSNDTAAAGLEVLQPELRLLPAVATPGEATLAYGVDFPPGARLDLVWSRGITPWTRPVTVAADGTVRTPMLVLPGDELGQRLLVATASGGPGFGQVAAPPMLVVPRTAAPPTFLDRG